MTLLNSRKEWLDYKDSFEYYYRYETDEPSKYPVIVIDKYSNINNTKEYVEFEFIYEEDFLVKGE